MKSDGSVWIHFEGTDSQVSSGGAGEGSVTAIRAGVGLLGGTVTITGSFAIDQNVVATLTGSQTLLNKTLNFPAINNGALNTSSTQVITSTGANGSTAVALQVNTTQAWTDLSARLRREYIEACAVPDMTSAARAADAAHTR